MKASLKTFLTIITFFCFNFFESTKLYAQDAGVTIPTPPISSTEQDPGAVMSPLKKDQKAPFTGTLLSPRTIAIIVAELHAYPKKCQIDVDKAVSQCKAESTMMIESHDNTCDATKRILTSQVKMLEDKSALDAKKIADLQKQQTNPLVWLIGGLAGGVVLTSVIVYVAHQ